MLVDDEWSITYGGSSLTFGSPFNPVFNQTTPVVGDVALRVADADRPSTDGRAFGVDFLGGQTVSFDLGVRGNGEAEVRTNLAELRQLWRADTLRQTPGAVAELSCRYAGRERVTYGRPRRFDALTESAKSGLATVVADFACVDDLWYGPESTQSVKLVPSATGGLVAPLASPLSTTASSDRSVGLTVAGDAPAWLVITVAGPIVNPVVEVVGLFRLSLGVTLAGDQVLVIDTRPWMRSVLIDGTQSVAGTLTRTSARLRDTSVPPGTYELALRGQDITGTASAALRWRTTHLTP